jgi:hypothetical protein
MRYAVEAAKEWGAGTGPNGYGKRAKVSGAYTIEVATGRRVRAFTDREGGIEAAQKWATYLEERMP